MYDEMYSANLLVKTDVSVMNRIKQTWEKYFPDTPIRLTFFDQFIKTMLTKEDHQVSLLSFLLLFIAIVFYGII